MSERENKTKEAVLLETRLATKTTCRLATKSDHFFRFSDSEPRQSVSLLLAIVRTFITLEESLRPQKGVVGRGRIRLDPLVVLLVNGRRQRAADRVMMIASLLRHHDTDVLAADGLLLTMRPRGGLRRRRRVGRRREVRIGMVVVVDGGRAGGGDAGVRLSTRSTSTAPLAALGVVVRLHRQRDVHHLDVVAARSVALEVVLIHLVIEVQNALLASDKLEQKRRE